MVHGLDLLTIVKCGGGGDGMKVIAGHRHWWLSMVLYLDGMKAAVAGLSTSQFRFWNFVNLAGELRTLAGLRSSPRTAFATTIS